MVGWRIETIDGDIVDFEGKIFITIPSYSDLNTTDGKALIKEKYISYYEFDDEILNKFNAKGGLIYCIDGIMIYWGYWNNYFVYYDEIQLHYWPKRSIYGSDQNLLHRRVI